MIQLFKRLLQPGSLLGFALIAIGVNLGTVYGLEDFKSSLKREYTVSEREWSKFAGDVWSLQPSILTMALIFYALSVLAAPEANRSDRLALRRLATAKLSQNLLTEEETVFWSRLLEEVKEDV